MWKDVVGYEGIYEVSNCGLVRTHKDKVTHSELHGIRHWKQRFLKQKNDKDGYRSVTLYKSKKHEFLKVHRLVAYAFIPLIEGKKHINHIDGDPSNNSVENLEWCNHQENVNHRYDKNFDVSAKQIVLLHKKTKESFYFRSQQKASEFLGEGERYVSNRLGKGVTELAEYIIFTIPKHENRRGQANEHT